MLSALKNLIPFKSYSARLYIGMLLLVLVLAIAVSFLQGEVVYHHLINSREKELAALADNLGKNMSTRYEEEIDKDTKSQEHIIEELAEELQEHVRTDIVIGYYDKRLNRVITNGPDLSWYFLKGMPSDSVYFNYSNGKVDIIKNPSSLRWKKRSVFGAVSPVKKDGKIVGLAWVNMETKKNIDAVAHSREGLLIATMSIFLVGLLGVHLISRRSKRALHEFADCMKNLHSDNAATYTIEELAPLIAEVKAIQFKQMDLALQNERLDTIAQLAAGFAHDIRNPLTSIRGFLQLISTRVAADDRDFINISIEELDGINRLIQDMLYLSRPPESNFEKVYIGDLLTNIKDFVTPEANLKEIVFNTRIQHNLPAILLDSGQMRQVFINLIRNAFEAITSKGEILLSAYSSDKEITIEIKDNGIGIPETEQEKIFDALYTTKNNGTGLGLAICREIIARHKGSISIKSKVGTGTTIIIKIPVEDPGLVNGAA